MAELGAYYVSIVPTMKGASKQINDQLAGISGTKAGEKIGRELGGTAGKVLDLSAVAAKFTQLGSSFTKVGGELTKGITLPAMGAATAVGGLVAGLGFKRLVGIDTARGQFKGLGYDADQVMTKVSEGVNNTALSMADGASLAVAALATGNLPLEGLEAQLKRVANVSAAYGVDSQQAGYLLNNVLTKNKVTYGDLSQMVQNQIPIISQLAEHYGVSGDEIEKMAQRGEISIEDLNAVLDKNAGAAAEEYAKTWQGVTSNILSNLGKIGAALLEPTFEIVKDKAADFLEYLKTPEFKDAAANIGQSIAEFAQKAITAVQNLISWWTNLSSTMQKVVVAFAGVAVAAGPVLLTLGKLFTSIGSIINVGVKLAPVFKALAPVFTLVKTAVTLLGGALKGLFTVMLTNPIGILITAIAAVVAGLVLFFTKTELGRQIWQSITDWFQAYVMPIFTAAGEMFSAIGDRIGQAWQMLWSGVLQPVWMAMQDLFAAVWAAIQAAWDVVGPPLIAAIQTGWQMLSTVLGGLWNNLTIVFSAAWAIIQNTLQTVMGVIQGVITTVTAIIKGDWSGAWEAIKGIFSTVWNGMKSHVEIIINAIKGVISNVLTTIKSVWSTAWNAVKTKFTDIWNGIKSGATSGVNAVYNTVVGIKSRITGFFSNAGSWLVDAGRNIMDGFLKGLTAAFEKVKDFVGGIGSWIADHKGPKAYDLALLVPAGGWIMEGLEDGLTNQFESVKRAVNAFGPDLESVFSANLHAPLTGAAAFGGIPATSGVGAPGGVTQNFEVHTDDPALVAAVAMDRMRRPIY